MRLSLYTDHAIRLLIHLGAHEGGLTSIAAIAEAYGISQNNLMKVVQDLGRAGYVETVRGRGGGIRLGRTAEAINLGELVRRTETNLKLVDCEGCLVSPACGLPGILAEATRAFLGVLDRYTLADLIRKRVELRDIFGISGEEESGATAVIAHR